MHIHELCGDGGHPSKNSQVSGNLMKQTLAILPMVTPPLCPGMPGHDTDMPGHVQGGGVTEPEIAKVLEIVIEVFKPYFQKPKKFSHITKFFITASDFGESTRRSPEAIFPLSDNGELQKFITFVALDRFLPYSCG